MTVGTHLEHLFHILVLETVITIQISRFPIKHVYNKGFNVNLANKSDTDWFWDMFYNCVT